MCQDLLFCPVNSIPASSEPLTFLVQDPKFFCSLARTKAGACHLSLGPGPSNMGQVFTLNPDPIISAGFALPVSAVEGTKGRTSPFLFVFI